MKPLRKNIKSPLCRILYLVPFFALFLFTGNSLVAQNIQEVLRSVEVNNTTLKALKESVEAQKLENRTGISLTGPEIGFNYLWGDPAAIGNRTDINISQRFDIPTLSGMKSKLADGKNNLAELEYQSERMNILLEAKQYCIELTYYNALKTELDERLEHARGIASGYRQRLEQGDINILEYNKAELNLSTVRGELSRIDAERAFLQAELGRLNGGIRINPEDSVFEAVVLPENFEDWYMQAAQKNPVLAWLRQDIENSQHQLKLNRTMNLPSVSAGYMSEKIVGEHFQGITLGASIPLWENRNRVRQAKAAVQAAEARQADYQVQFYNQLQSRYEKARVLQSIALDYRTSLTASDNIRLLKKALDAGEISLLDYLVEIGLYYDTVNRTLEAERDFQKAFAELSAVTL